MPAIRSQRVGRGGRSAKRVVLLVSVLVTAACGTILARDPDPVATDPSLDGATANDARDPAAGDANATGDARDARADTSDGACTLSPVSCPPSTICSVARKCIAPLEAGAPCQSSYECASSKCARDGSVCTEGALCEVQSASCFASGGNDPCCLGLRCEGTMCSPCFVSGQDCTTSPTCCSSVCDAGRCQ